MTYFLSPFALLQKSHFIPVGKPAPPLPVKLESSNDCTITFLSKSNKPVSVNELQDKVWSYQSDIETHTVETHIYRLRKKILKTFNDNDFIISKKNGYQIK